MNMNKLKLFLAFALLSVSASAFSQVALNPCNSNAVRSTKAIAITSATTTEIVPLVANQTVYVCSVDMTISQVVTTANTIKFVYGTGTACATGTTDITGAFGTGGIIAAPPLVVSIGPFKGAVSNAICATTTIGGSAAFSGVMSYIQQ